MPPETRTIAVDLSFLAETPVTLVAQLRPAASAGQLVAEQLFVSVNGVLAPETEQLAAEVGGRLDRLSSMPGTLRLTYSAEVLPPAAPVAPMADFDGAALERLIFMRPSRYCPSDHIGGLAQAEFGHLLTPRERVAAIEDYIHRRVAYVSGSSGVNDWAEDTLLTGVGVCRDFAHLGITLCRALDVPARFVAVYAPGLDPMDFHAVFEAWHDGAWWCYDATRKVPGRPSSGSPQVATQLTPRLPPSPRATRC